MVLKKLGQSLSSLLTKISKTLTIDKKAVEGFLKELKLILLEADVSVELVENLVNKVEKRFFEEKTPAGLTKREHFLKILYEEIVNLLGKEFEPFKIEKKPFVILMVGLLGSGKTTTTVKLARYFQKKGYNVGIICADIYRPAAFDQLKQLAEKIRVPVYFDSSKDVIKIIKNGLAKFSKKDVILIDTAGRHKEETRLMEEIKQIYEKVKPDEVILTVDASIGQIAKVQAEAFSRVCPVGSIIVTKLDGTARGGGALSACAATGAKIRFVGVGEKIEDLEPYDAKRFVSRMLGLGDLETLLEKAKEVGIKEEKVEKIVEEFTLEDFLEQIENLSKMGPLSKIAQLLPGFGLKIPEEIWDMQEEKMKKFKAIIQSMTLEERKNPEIINESRIRRIAKGSGTREEDVRELLSQYKKLRKLLKKFGKIRQLDLTKLSKMLRKFGFSL